VLVYESNHVFRNIALDVASGKMYWTDTVDHAVERGNLDGSDVESVVQGLGLPRGIALDLTQGKIYWTDSELENVQRANLDGSDVELLMSGTRPYDIALDLVSGQMYVAASFEENVVPGVAARGVVVLAALMLLGFTTALILGLRP
jgi:low density lipoprotein receptor-related protein 5/6